MENGQVLDAGRGLPAIEQIKQIIGAKRIHVVSEHADLNGLSFDAQGRHHVDVGPRRFADPQAARVDDPVARSSNP